MNKTMGMESGKRKMFKTGCLLEVRYRLEKAFCYRLFLDGSAVRHANLNDHFTNCAIGVLLKSTLPAFLLAQVL